MRNKNEIVEEFQTQRARYMLTLVYCGKTGCAKCPHGPYWYVEFIFNGRRHKKYIGKNLVLLKDDLGLFRKKGKRYNNASEEVDDILKLIEYKERKNNNER